MPLIGRGDKPRDRRHSADYHTNLSTGNAVKCSQMQTSSAETEMLATTGSGNYRRMPKDTERYRKLPKATESLPEN